MKSSGALLVVCFLAAVAWSSLAQAQQQQDFRQVVLLRGLQVLSSCRQSTGASEEDVWMLVRSRRVPTSRTGQCLIACVAQNYGLMRGGQFDPEGALSLVRNFMQMSGRNNNERLYAEIQNAITTCGNSVSSRDSCELAAKLTQCGLQQAETIRARYGRQ